ncbi:MAG: hypothetical protein FWB71_04380 [Defluviitaleaceae bacterium]|nr:hypothetical protein [Defluviitaleaceae bacterium]
MKYVLLSADNNPSVYLVPDIVADNLEKYCIDFGNIIRGSFDETDFIRHLNKIFPDNPPQFIEMLDKVWYEIKHRKVSYENVPEKYQNSKWFNF